MRVLSILAACLGLAAATIEENGQPRLDPYPGQAPRIQPSKSLDWKSYSPNATELSYKGRWDDKHISWWSAPGLKFGYTGGNVAITFGQYTDPGVLVAYRIDGLDWQFSNVTGNATYQFASSGAAAANSSSSTTASGSAAVADAQTLEIRVTNWAYGVQIDRVWTSADGGLVKIANHPLMLEFIGDSLTSGMYGTYEGLSSFGWGVGAGLGGAEFSITAYPGVCVHDAVCWGNAHGQSYQWLRTSDTSWRATQLYGDDPPRWDFSRQQPADYVLINLGTNDNNTANPVTPAQYVASYIKLIEEVHDVWPDAQVVVSSVWNGFYQSGNNWFQGPAFVDEIPAIVDHFRTGEYAGAKEFVHLFDTTGILQHNDIGPQWHPTDVGHIKVASHLLRFLNIKFGVKLAATGPEVQHGTLYWNTQQNY